MRFFYDLRSSEERSRSTMLIADMIAIVAAVGFASGAPRSGASSEDLVLFATWCVLPLAISPGVGWLTASRHGTWSFGLSLSFLALVGTLLVAGWELLEGIMPRETPLDSYTVLVIVAAWATGFFLFHPGTYRLQDFLLSSLVVLGLVAGRPLVFPSLALFLGAFYLSSAVRHAYLDGRPSCRTRRLNLQNSRRVALLALLSTLSPAMLGTYLATGSIEPRPSVERGPPPNGTSTPFLARGDEGDETGRAVEGRGDAAKAAEGDARPRVVGFSYRVPLRDLSLASFDRRLVLRARGKGASVRTAPRLWRAVCLSTFEPALESWAEETEYATSNWPESGSLARTLPAVSDAAPRLRLEVRIETPVVRSFVGPYHLAAIESPSSALFRENVHGDVYPSPTIEAESEFAVLFVPPESAGTPPSQASGRHPDPRFRLLPPGTELGMDLDAEARRIFTGRDAVLARVEDLRRHFRAGFRYASAAAWRAGTERLREFLLVERVGNCTYFATATTLLLRAGGVSTRLAVGFRGGRWDERRREFIVRNQDAHAWTEAWIPDWGWIPVDATDWVPTDETYQPSPEALEELQALARRPGVSSGGTPADPAPSNPRERGARFGELGDEPPPSEAAGTGHTPTTGDSGSTDLAALEREEEDVEASLWIQYDTLAGDSGAGTDERGGWAAQGRWDPQLDGSRDEASSERRGLAERESAGPRRGLDSARLGALLRGAIALTALVVLGILLVQVLRPAKRMKRRRRRGEPTPEESQPAGGEEAPLPALDPTIPSERVCLEYEELQRALERTRHQRPKHATPIEHGRGLARRHPEIEDAILSLHRALYRVVYGRRAVDEATAREATRNARRIRRFLT